MIRLLITLLIASPTLAGTISYNRDVRPILSENCFSCHGFDEKHRKAKLRLDQSGSDALTPGDIAKSEAWQRIISEDADELMPPPESHLKLTAAEKKKIKTWIEQGAKYEGHWAFVAPLKAALSPKAKHPVDAFVHQRLHDENLSPSAPADPAMLMRRVCLDLTGLPPSAEEVAVFTQACMQDREGAYAALVERLLRSPHFGERMALDWLDAARYADTNGFSIDGGRNLWLWRDWVIQAFNDNLPYDQFLAKQLAGDLMPNRSQADLIATGFQRNNMVTHEGGTIPAENLTNYNADRVKTLGESVLGLTLACAQCHDHKFDPITQKDYFQMFAFFNSLSDKGLDGNGGINPGPFARVKTVLKTDELPALEQEIAHLKMRLSRRDEAILTPWIQQQQAQLAVRGSSLKLHPVSVLKTSTPGRGSGFEVKGDAFVRVTENAEMGAFDISTQLPKLSEPITAVRITLHPSDKLPGGGWGSGPQSKRAAAKGKGQAKTEFKGSFVLTALAATAGSVPNDQVNLHKLERIQRVTANTWQADSPPAGCLDPRNDTGWAPDLSHEGPVHLTATFAQPLDATATPYFTVQLNFGRGQNYVPGVIEISVLTGQDEDSDLPAPLIADLLANKASDDLWQWCASHAVELKRTRTDLANLEDRRTALKAMHTTMVMDVASKPRDTFILDRGDYAKPTVKVSAGTLSALPALPDQAVADRLGLAQWITMKGNPLTARVAVNRLWKLLFGTGIVATAADFGMQGEWPSHPDLLDWLAVEFMESGWDVKHMMKLMVMSQTYRQTSATRMELIRDDPANRLLARGSRFRLPAELLRDAALKTSGLLVPRIGGPSVNPYMPGDLWREVSHYGSSPATAQTFVQDHGEKLYRRSLYTYWKRTAPPPNMMAFDAPNREVCTIARGNTTTPLQALVSLNDPQFVEAARVFAQRIMQQTGDDSAKLRWAVLEATSREPREKELAVLMKALNRERDHYSADAALAKEALSVGEAERDAQLSATDHAAWMQLASLLLNLSETVTRN